MKKRLVYLVFFAFLFAACSTDFNINAEWKEITVVYGLLNQNETTHYIKINKAFLGDGNALTMAQVEDSSSYFNNLEVKVEEWKNGSMTNSYPCDTTTIYNKEPGVFYYPKQILYKFNATLYEDRTYKLSIKNKISGKLITSETPMVYSFVLTKPISTSVGFSASSNTQMDAKWESAINGRRYQLNIRFPYKEVNLSPPYDTTNLYVDWQFPAIKSTALSGGEGMITSYTGKGFFTNLANRIPVNPGVNRFPGDGVTYSVEFIISVAGDDLNTYMEVSEPSTGIVQEKPGYTNINNGIGIFSCRYTKVVNLKLTGNTVTDLLNSSITGNLGFK